MRKALLAVLVLALSALPVRALVTSKLTVTKTYNGPHGDTLPASCAPGDQFHLDAADENWIATSGDPACTWSKQDKNLTSDSLNHQNSGTWNHDGKVTTPGNQFSVDWFWPGNAPHFLGALRTPTWIDVPAGSNRLRIRSMRLLTGSRSWSFAICGSRTRPETCRYSVLCGSSYGWSLWYADSEANYDYEDLDGDATPQIHFHVMTCDGGWMTFRPQIEGDLH